MWSPWVSARFHLKRSDMLAENVSLREFLAMWDAAQDGEE